jgi:hypothetical protein
VTQMSKQPHKQDYPGENCCGDCGSPLSEVDENPVLDYPMGPGWYWYQHPDTVEDNDKGPQKVDPTMMEIVCRGTEFLGMWQGNLVPLTAMTGKWQRAKLSAFHGGE